MATTIGNTSSDIYASMNNSAWARSISIPSNWTKIRLGCRYRVTDLGIGPTGTPRMGMGLCSGTTNILGDATTTHFVGVLTNSASWNYYGAAGGAVYYSINLPPYKRVGTTDTFGTNTLTDGRFTIFTASTNNRYVYFIEIVKGSPNYTINTFTVSGASPTYDSTQNEFLNNLQVPAGTLSISSFTYGSAQTIAVNEAVDGTLNAINFYWDRAAFNFEVHDVGIALIT